MKNSTTIYSHEQLFHGLTEGQRKALEWSLEDRFFSALRVYQTTDSRFEQTISNNTMNDCLYQMSDERRKYCREKRAELEKELTGDK